MKTAQKYPARWKGCLLLPIFLVLLSARAGAEPVIKIDGSFHRARIGKMVSYIEDKEHRYTINNIRRNTASLPFVPSEKESPGFGYTQSVYWLRFIIQNTTKSDIPLFLEINNAILDCVEVYSGQNNKKPVMIAGDHVPFKKWSFPYRNIVSPLTVRPGSNRYFMRVSTTSNMNLPMILWNADSFYKCIQKELAYLWVFYGILLSMFFYNLFLFISSRSKDYLYYVFVIAGFALFRFAYDGFGFQYLWPDSIWWANNSVPLLIVFFASFLILFTRRFILTWKYTPRADRFIIMLLVLELLGIIPVLMGEYRIAIQLILGVGFIISITLIVLGAFILRKGSRDALFYIISWGLFLMGSALNILRDFGIFPVNFITTWGQEFGAAAQVLIISLGLADRINTMKAEITRSRDELAEANKLINEESELLAVTLRSIGDAVITTDLNNHILLLNREAERLTGWDPGDARGKTLNSVLHILTGKNGEEAPLSLDRILTASEVRGIEKDIILLTPKGERINIALTVSSIRNYLSEVIGAVIIFRDITEQLRVERDMIKRSKLESLGVFAGGIAHDFNNILTVIIGNLSLAHIELDSKSAIGSAVTDALNISYRARDLTQQLLTFSKGGEPIKKVIDLDDLLHESASFIIRGSQTTISFDITDTLWNVNADEGQISQVINNIVINAMQAMPKGGKITISAENVTIGPVYRFALPPGQYVCISISDEGPGIPEDVASNIFDPFFTTKENGSGLGLSSVYSIISKHEGYIFLDTSCTKGACFRIYLPAEGGQPATHHTKNGPLIKGKGRVLIMDDEDMVREVAARLVTSLGYTVDTTLEGKEAVEKYRAAYESGTPYNCVILDLTVPGGMGGKEALTQMREIYPGVKAIVSSGYSNDPVMAHYREHGFTDIMVKPYTITVLSKVLHRVINSA